MRAAGWKTEDFAKPIITVACPWSTALPCNYHFRELGDAICNAVEERGGKAFICGAPVVADGEVQKFNLDGLTLADFLGKDLHFYPISMSSISKTHTFTKQT